MAAADPTASPPVIPPAKRRRRRRGRLPFIAMVTLLVVAVGLLALDRTGRSYAEREIANRVSQELTAQKIKTGPPRVTVGGAPFLPQVAEGRYPEITILLPDVAAATSAGQTIRMPVLDIRARDLRAPLDAVRTGRGDIVVSAIAGAGKLDYPQVAQLTGQAGLVLEHRDGRLVGTAPVQAVGRTFTLTGTVNLTVAGNVIRVRFANVTFRDVPNVPLIESLLNSYIQRLSVDVPLPQLPLGLVVQSIEPRADGLHVTVGGENVPLAKARS